MTQIKKYFTNLIDPKLLVMLFIVLAVCIILTMVFSQKVPEFKQKFKSKFFIYQLSFALVYAIVALLGYNKLLMDNTLYEFIFYQFCSLILGIIHTYMYRSYFNKFGNGKVGYEYLFALITVFYSFFSFLLIYTFLNGTDYLYLVIGHFIVFFIPLFINDTFNRGMAIPAKIYKTWQFPANYKETAGVSDEEMRDLVVLTFLIKKDNQDYKYRHYRAKGPTRLDFGRLFYNFVLDYNDKHSEDPIAIEDSKGLYNWVFFLQPKWYESTKYIDPDYTLYMNGIEENSVVICMRTDEVLLDEQKNKENKKEEDYEYKYDREEDNNRVEN